MDGTFFEEVEKNPGFGKRLFVEKNRGFAALEFTHFFDHCGWFGSWSGLDPLFFDCWLDVVLLNFKEVMICWNRNLGNSTLVQSTIYIIHVYIIHQHHKQSTSFQTNVPTFRDLFVQPFPAFSELRYKLIIEIRQSRPVV